MEEVRQGTCREAGLGHGRGRAKQEPEPRVTQEQLPKAAKAQRKHLCYPLTIMPAQVLRAGLIYNPGVKYIFHAGK